MLHSKRLIVALVAAAALGAMAVGGVVFAQTPQPAPGGNAPGSAASGGDGMRARIDGFLNQLAQNLKIDRPTLDNALKTTAKGQVDQAVTAGRLTQDQANQIKQRIDSGQAPFGFGGLGRMGGRGLGRAGAAARCGATVRDAVSSALGVSAADLRQARASGQSVAQIAQAHGKTLEDVRGAVASAAKGCLDTQVQAGKLTQQQEQDLLQRLQDRLNSAPGQHRNGGSQNRTFPGPSGASSGASQ